MSSKNQGAASKNSNTDNKNGSNIVFPILCAITMLKLISILGCCLLPGGKRKRENNDPVPSTASSKRPKINLSKLFVFIQMLMFNSVKPLRCGELVSAFDLSQTKLETLDNKTKCSLISIDFYKFIYFER